MNKKLKASPLEMQILVLLWEREALTVREVLEQLSDGKQRAYTSILSVMQVMEKKGLLGHERIGPANRYYAKAAKKSVMGPYLRSLVANLFGGSPRAAIQELLEENEVDASEMTEIRRLIEDYGQGESGEGGDP